LGKTSGPTQGRNPCHRQISGVIFTMNFNPTWNVSASESNLTGLQAGRFGWPHSEDRRFGKTCWRGWQPARRRFGCNPDEPKTENEP